MEHSGARSRGIRTRLAEALSCHTAYISRVLNANAHLSLEQAHLLNDFFEHTQSESHFFLLLVQKARAGHFRLEKYFEEQLQAETARRRKLKNRLSYSSLDEKEKAETYYSSWLYPAVHIGLCSSKINTVEEVSKHFNISFRKASTIINYLLRAQLAKQTDDGIEPLMEQLHLPADSPLAPKYQIEWRLRTIQAIQQSNDQDVHYASVITVSERDKEKVRKEILKCIENIRSIVRHTESDECVSAYLFDFYDLKEF